jgi:hypothetical protein
MAGAEHAWDTVHSLRTEHTINGIHRFLEWARAARAAQSEAPDAVSEESAETEVNTRAEELVESC